ncbi:MAG: ABC transporter ATP-binding protein/permease [Crocinitomicaceae bacterium]|nr:ABC transporter ATP-binding protein/permease [Crocinitomicaceae bacterium]MDP4723416.1 ABC transporter ATP-binding protein/permease [Crocinitomicaceae bacterium]MDP4739396.1 ABC transporter ATP-binding protein/permease [Crocinitomicaceae bacterium]MDP4867870.1 ABC transporter ATP-binding protein/permease [Crocinitomicaceae bacterium]MDP5043172.1 ABC transporter ATP-binding protein/permease [Crocinitomicaceae bacterium]
MSQKLQYSLFKRLFSFAKPYKKYLVVAVSATILLAALSPSRPYVIGQIIDRYLLKDKDPNMLLLGCLLVLIMLLSEAVLQVVGTYFSNLLAQSVIRDLRQKVIRHFMKLRVAYFDKNPVGAMVTRVVSDMEAITEVFSSGMMDIAADLLSLILIVLFMFLTDWQLALMTLIPVPLLIWATRIFARAMKSSFQQERQAVTKLNTFVQERLTGISLVQLFNRQQQEARHFEQINSEHRAAHIKAVWANSIFFPFVELLSSLSIAFLLVWGAIQAAGKSEQEVSNMFGELFAFVFWISQLYRPIRMLADKFNVLQRGTVRAERIFAVLDEQTDVQDKGHLTEVDFNQNLRFQGVHFAYVPDQPVITDLNLEINYGQTVAIVGATGSGKTTLVNLLGRFYEHQSGQILIGKVPIEEIELPTLRKNIAIVLQDVFLFSDTVFNNITLGDPNISLEQVITAAKEVGAHDFISALPDQYAHKIGERGGTLSTGQRQLLAFIRAYVYQPSLLILDEATSSVDSESEFMIQRATDQLTAGRTSIVIAHRLSTIRKADRIIVMEKGRIIEQGTHEELLEFGGHYKNLSDRQYFNQEA